MMRHYVVRNGRPPRSRDRLRRSRLGSRKLVQRSRTPPAIRKLDDELVRDNVDRRCSRIDVSHGAMMVASPETGDDAPRSKARDDPSGIDPV